ILEIDEVDFPFGAVAPGYHPVGLLTVAGVNAGVMQAADFAGDRGQHRTTMVKPTPAARQYDLAHDASAVERFADHVTCANGAERAGFGRGQRLGAGEPARP